MKTSPRIALFGAYGSGNYGNAAIAAGMRFAIRSLAPGALVEELIPAHCVWPHCVPVAGDRVRVADLSEPRQVEEINNDFDLFIIGGGRLETVFAPLFVDPTGVRSLRHPVAAVRRLMSSGTRAVRFLVGFRSLKMPRVIHGMSFGGEMPWEPGLSNDRYIEHIMNKPRIKRRLAVLRSWVFPQIEAIGMRGEISSRLLGDKRVSMVCDPAFFLPEAAGGVPERDIAVAVRPWPRSVVFLGKLASALDDLIDKDHSVTFFVMSDNDDPAVRDDAAVTREIMGLMRHGRQCRVKAPHGMTPGEFIPELRRFGTVITMRLHLAILASLAGSRVIPIPVEAPKFMEVLDMMGIRGNTVTLERMDPALLVDKMETKLSVMDRPRMAPFREAHSRFLERALAMI